MKESKKLFKVQLGFGEDDKKLKRANNIRQIVFLAHVQKKSTLSYGRKVDPWVWIWRPPSEAGFGVGSELLRLDQTLSLKETRVPRQSSPVIGGRPS